MLAAAPLARAVGAAGGLQCAEIDPAPAAGAPSLGNPCWTDVLRYPFGADGNPVDPTSPSCDGSAHGPNWLGDFRPSGSNISGNPPCYLMVTSLAFRAWNRGLAATSAPLHADTKTVAYGVWLFNGNNWFPDPTFPGNSACPGSTILWAGKLDYWLVGSSTNPQRTLCRFDGVNLTWEPLSLPAATVARLPVDANGNVSGGVTSGACYAWNNCWFFGDDGIRVHWDGQQLSDASVGPTDGPWLRADFTAAVSGTDSSGRPFGLAVTKSSSTASNATSPAVPPQPDGSPPPQLFGSQGGPFAPLTYSPPATPEPNDPFTTDLTKLSTDSQGDVWVAADPAARLHDTYRDGNAEPAPLLRLGTDGAAAYCAGYGAGTFAYVPATGAGYAWTALATFPSDASALAGAQYQDYNAMFSPGPGSQERDIEPVIVRAACGQAPTITRFREPDPFGTAQQVPADYNGQIQAVAANAANDAWAASSDGTWSYPDQVRGDVGGPQAPHLYRWTDGQPPQAPAGDDSETRPSLFTLDPPIYQQAPPPVVVLGGTTTTQTRHTHRTVKLPPAIYALHSHLVHGSNGALSLRLSFKVRRPVTIGLEGLRGNKVVASTGLRRFAGHRGELTLTLNRQHWPTKVRLVLPKTKGTKGKP